MARFNSGMAQWTIEGWLSGLNLPGHSLASAIAPSLLPPENFRPVHSHPCGYLSRTDTSGCGGFSGSQFEFAKTLATDPDALERRLMSEGCLRRVR